MDNTTANGQVATANATKKVNYTDEQKNQVVELYIKSKKDSSNDNLAKIGVEVGGRTAPSIRQVLIGEGVYVSVGKTSKAKTTQMPKVTLVRALESQLELKSGTLDTVEKANKQALNDLLDAVQTLNEDSVESDEE